MAYIDNDRKYAIIINQRSAPAIVLNAVAHASSGFDGMSGGSEFLEYPNNERAISARIARYPVIVLSAKNSNQIGAFVGAAHAQALPINYFTMQMIDQSAERQIENNRNATWQELEFVCAIVFGERSIVDPLTKRFSLYK